MDRSITENRMLEEFSKRKKSIEKKHELELDALKKRQKKEIEVLNSRYSVLLKGGGSDRSVH